MYNFFRKNQKKMMAVLGVILMIAFIIPTATTRMAGNYDRAVGTIGASKVLQDDVRAAEDQWNYLSQRVHVQQRTPDGQTQWVPITFALLPHVYQQMRQSPEIYYLLQLEARKMGVAPNLDSINAVLSQTRPAIGIAMPDGTHPSFDRVEQIDETTASNVRQCMANLLLVNDAFQRAVNAVKISQPLARHIVADQLQQVKVRLVDFQARAYESRVPAPTTQQLQQQFDQFSNFEAGSAPTQNNPFGLGYKYPNRVKLQYIEIPREQVRKAILATKDDYSWEVEANRYYFKHPEEFPATQSATTQETFALGPSQHKTTAPAVKPFAQVRQQVINALVDPLADKLLRQIQSDIKTELVGGYQAYSESRASTTQQSAPTTSSQPSYGSFEYLQNLAREIQRKYHVTITVASIADSFKNAAELRLLPGIGQLSVAPQLPFAQYATTYVDVFHPASANSSDVLALFQPSKPLATFEGGDVYFFRITDAQPAHKPPSIGEVKDDLQRDWQRLQAYEMAKADAQKLLDLARRDGFDSAAAGKKIITTGEFPLNAAVPIENYSLTTPAQADFLRCVYELLSVIAANEHAHPVALAQMPPDSRLAVVELLSVQSGLGGTRSDLAEMFFTQQLMQEYRRQMAADWFSYDSIAQRLGYQDLTGSRSRQ